VNGDADGRVETRLNTAFMIKIISLLADQ